MGVQPYAGGVVSEPLAYPATRLILVRHGESNATVNRVIGGPRTCSGLSDHGRDQAEMLRDRLRSTGELTLDAIYASQYPRARETADIVLQAFPGMEVQTDSGFGEHDPGAECDGLGYDEFVARYGTGHDWRNPFAETFPGGETVAQFHFRVGTATHALVERHPGESILVVCHGGVVDCLMRQQLHLPPTGGFELFTLNTSITEMVAVGPATWRLVRYNDAAHLA